MCNQLAQYCLLSFMAVVVWLNLTDFVRNMKRKSFNVRQRRHNSSLIGLINKPLKGTEYFCSYIAQGLCRLSTNSCMFSFSHRFVYVHNKSTHHNSIKFSRTNFISFRHQSRHKHRHFSVVFIKPTFDPSPSMA